MRRSDSLGLFEYEVDKDGKQVFSIEQALNENWEILDSFSKDVSEKFSEADEKINQTEGKIKYYNVSYKDPVQVTVGDYYCPSDGIFVCTLSAAHSGVEYLYVNDVLVQRIYGETNQRVTGPSCIPVSTNDHVVVTGSAQWTDGWFIPC